MMRVLCFSIVLICSAGLPGAPPTTRPVMDPPAAIEPTGPVRLARYVKPFAPAQPNRATRDYAARHTYLTPFYFYGCGYYGGYGGWYGYGYGFCHPIYYPYGPYYPCY